MATQGQVDTSKWTGTYGNRYLSFYWRRESIDVAAQTTTIYWWLMMNGTNTSQVTCEPFQIQIDGTNVYWSDVRTKYGLYEEIADGYTTIQHNADGTKTFSVTVRGAIYSSSVNVTGSGNFTLEPVGKANILAAPNFTDEDNPTIAYENTVGNTITSLAAAISLTGETPDIPYREVDINGSSYTFNLTAAERKTLRAATVGSNSRKVRFYLRSIVGEDYFFSWMEVTFTVINAMPTIAAAVIDTNETTKALTGSVSTLIRYHSTAYAAMTATAYKEATIRTNVIEYNGTLTSNTTKTVPNVESNVFSFIASDSRGNTANETIVAPMIDYIRPTANIDTTQRMSAEGVYTLSVSGNYYNDTFGYTSAAAANTLTLQYRYKEQGGSYGSWVNMSPTITNNTYSASITLTGLDYRTVYVFQCRIVDKLNTVLSAEVTSISLPVYHWSDKDFVFEVPVTFNAGFTGEGETGGGSGECAIVDGTYTGDLKVTGDLWLKGSGNYGNTIYFGDKTYTYIQETPDDTLNIKATTINLNGTNINVNGSPIGSGGSSNATYGTWTPTLTTSAAVSSYTTRQGWYQKVGNVVTIGWQIKANIKNGYATSVIGISGCPFTPSHSAFGGGIADNVYMSYKFTFGGYVLGTDGVISLRGQICQLTLDANQSITSAVYYPEGLTPGLLTLGGSITFMTSN